MSKLRLPEVTLVISETMELELARLAVKTCLDKVEFGGGVLVLTNEPDRFPFKDCRFHKFSGQIDKVAWARAMWFIVPSLIHTSHILMIQWDSWVWRPDKWKSEFLDCDLIGAPWWYTDGKNVGNTGFGIKTTRMARYINDRRGEFPCNTGTEDDLLCRTYRPRLEKLGFSWASERLAHEFSRECCPPSEDHVAFGFHGAFNFGLPGLLTHDELMERARLMFQSPYLTKAGNYILKGFCDRNPAIVKELLDEESVTELTQA